MSAVPDNLSLELLYQAVEQAFNAVLITDAQPAPLGPRILYANAAFRTLSGYSATELLGQTPRILQGPLTDREVLDELRQCLDEGRLFHGSTVNYRKDGEPYWVEWNISPIRDAQGTITHYVSVQRSFSELVAAQSTSLLLSEALAASHDGVLITDENGIIEFANPAFESITGYRIAEILGRTPAFLRSGEHDDAFYADLYASLGAGRPFHATFADRHKDGHIFHADQTISPVRSRDDRRTHYVSIIRDLTARVHDEQALREAASLDALTGLYNRRGGEGLLERAYIGAREGGAPFCLILADIDHFKAINDNWGHPAGDRVLERVGRLLRACVRSTDGVVRWGGEEFMIILPHCELRAAAEQAERIRERIERTSLPDVGRITLSLGVAQFVAGEAVSTVIERADRALYQAKGQGRNRVCS
ncbi:diguanylate cyclase [Stutzerimonas stutzeri]|uniref:sensor domain-containing diguanylate cyclase n=1 Tax=Stutzerimonas sp. S1 TaxID=3030652 RepID=UPI002224736E|nr:diguanylate cyclase [Stutzerimonas sp. S1]MCW3147697.1 diguanylate cyclase [Stutzerimonas sp. S1]